MVDTLQAECAMNRATRTLTVPHTDVQLSGWWNGTLQRSIPALALRGVPLHATLDLILSICGKRSSSRS